MRILVTGSAGFIGSHVAHVLLDRGDEVMGLDNLNPYYEVALKEARLARLQARDRYHHLTADLADREAMERLFAAFKPDRVVHLAAQAGVRYAAENPHVYASSNLVGFLHGSRAAAATRSGTWCTRAPARCTAATPRCRSANRSRRNTR